MTIPEIILIGILAVIGIVAITIILLALIAGKYNLLSLLDDYKKTKK